MAVGAVRFQEIGDFGGGTGCRTRTLSGEAVSLNSRGLPMAAWRPAISGATNTTLRLENLATDDAGDYRLVARNTRAS